MTKNTVAGCIRLCYTVVYLFCMVLGLTIAPILFNAPGDTSGVGFQRFPGDINMTCDTTRGIVVNKFWLLLCVPVYICAYNVYLKVPKSYSALASRAANTCSQTPFRQWPVMIVVGSLGYGAGFATKHGMFSGLLP